MDKYKHHKLKIFLGYFKMIMMNTIIFMAGGAIFLVYMKTLDVFQDKEQSATTSAALAGALASLSPVAIAGLSLVKYDIKKIFGHIRGINKTAAGIYEDEVEVIKKVRLFKKDKEV